ncbi:hypothetical protein MFMK1_001490 [Metallumcola ferriviriculae]|uniref:Uncharacterized protein n=1 Tax=Metallumcola ferriviriculae TaxID=3039180 RepID=A0AAU0UNC3_9FIRM|nr:hypothetical protein MFMK1_001490 [Desulfitibacteraceae bacterium MK1]
MYNSLQGLIISGIFALMLLALVFSGTSIPFISEYWNATIILLVLGLFMCTFGAMGYILAKSTFSPITLVGSFLGVLALVIGALSFFNKTIPFLHGERQAFIAIAVIILLKVILARIQLYVIK